MYINVIEKDIEEFIGKNVILFGCGSCGIRVLEEFEKRKINILGFCDNNRELWGTTIEGKKVFKPDDLYYIKDISILITSVFEDEIWKQLRKLNLRKVFRLKVGVLKEKIPKELFHNQWMNTNDGNKFIKESLLGVKPFFIGRLGSVELETLSNYLYFLDRETEIRKDYPSNVKMMMQVNAGFFPRNDDLLDRFCRLYLRIIPEMDVIWSMWLSKFEDMIYSEFAGDKKLIYYNDTIMPIKSNEPWTMALKGKRVLVIHPFEESIRNNYKLIDKIFPNGFIPEFELVTLKAVQSIANCKTEYLDWFKALESMERQIDKIDFDVALVGAGAYGLALGAYIKEIGKQAVNIGGMLQLFFGIRGKAWDELGIYNENWSSPNENETPKEYRMVEAGRYW